jgi:hypothetical protein
VTLRRERRDAALHATRLNVLGLHHAAALLAPRLLRRSNARQVQEHAHVRVPRGAHLHGQRDCHELQWGRMGRWGRQGKWRTRRRRRRRGGGAGGSGGAPTSMTRSSSRSRRTSAGPNGVCMRTPRRPYHMDIMRMLAARKRCRLVLRCASETSTAFCARFF